MRSSVRQPGVVLVLDPDEAVLGACAEMLAGAELEVVTAATLRDALDRVDGGRIETVVASVRNPDSDAAAVLAAIRGRDPHLPLIFVETWPDFAGADDRESLRATVAAAAVGYRLGRRTRATRPCKAITPDG